MRSKTKRLRLPEAKMVQHFLCVGDTGAGKALDADTPVLTPDGYVPLRSIKVGALVIGSKGLPIAVTGVFPQGIKPAYRVDFDDDTSAICCDEHLWEVSTKVNRYRGQRPVMSLGEIRRRMSEQLDNRFSIPVNEPVDFASRTNLPIDPYVLGALIGNGDCASPTIKITIPDQTQTQLLNPGIAALGMELVQCRARPIDYYTRMTTEYRGDPLSPRHLPRNTVKHPLKEVLTSLMLRVGSHAKHIPKEYLFASIEHRLSLLQGLMDTDGSPGDHGMVEYSTASELLAKDILFLVRSLGCVARMVQRQTSYTYNGADLKGRDSYRLFIRIPLGMQPFRLKRKAERFVARTSFSLLRIIQSITPIGERDMICIKVAAEDGLFLINDFILTHNTQILKQIVYDAVRVGDCCIINDSKDGEYIQEFYRPERGDIILNPKDLRCPYWLFSDEFNDEAEALTVMRAFFPSHPANPQAQFWDDYACRLTAFLTANAVPALDCASLAGILISEKAIARRVVRTEYGQLFDVDGGGSSNMRTSVLQTINQIGYALRMMPSRHDADLMFSIREWSKERRGWIFLSNTESVAEAIIPLQSAWIDMILNRLLSDGPHEQRVRIILDELDTLNQLPKLQRAMTKLRSSGNIMALGIQNTAQLEDRYGRQANTIFSQSGTKYIARTSDDMTAKKLQETIGEIEVRQVNQTRTAGIMGGRERDSYSGPNEVRKPLVLASEIQGLPDLQGYLLQAPTDDEVGLHVVHIALPYYPLVKRQPGLLPRIIQRMDVPGDAINVTPVQQAQEPRQGSLVRFS